MQKLPPETVPLPGIQRLPLGCPISGRLRHSRREPGAEKMMQVPMAPLHPETMGLVLTRAEVLQWLVRMGRRGWPGVEEVDVAGPTGPPGPEGGNAHGGKAWN